MADTQQAVEPPRYIPESGSIIDLPLPSLPVAIFQADRDGRIAAANLAFRALALGGEVPSARTTPWSNAHPADRSVAEAAWRQASEAEADFVFEFRVWHRDGRLLWVRVNASPVRDEMGRIHAGCNIENAAYPQGWCAETSAIAALVMAGGNRIVEVVVIGNGHGLCTPCGGCRQKIREFAAGDVKIHSCTEDGELVRTFTLDELLPASFGPENLL